MFKPVLAMSFLAGCLMAPAQSTQPSSMSGTPSSSESTAAPSPAPAPAAATAPAAPQTVSVTIRSSCGKTAKVFYGDKPGFSSGTQSSVSSNSVESKTFRVGDQMWVLDDAGKPLASARIDAGTRQIEIAASCESLSAR